MKLWIIEHEENKMRKSILVQAATSSSAIKHVGVKEVATCKCIGTANATGITKTLMMEVNKL